MNAPIFITGGAGFLGKNTIVELHKHNYPIIAVQNVTPITPAPGLKIVHASLTNKAHELSLLMSGCETLIHLAGATCPSDSFNDPIIEVERNLVPTLNLLKAAEMANIKRIVFASSGGTVYGKPNSTPIDETHPANPTCPYAAFKLTQEHLIRLWAEKLTIPYIILRIANPYGPHQQSTGPQGVIGKWLPLAIKRKPITIWGDGNSIRDYTYVSDVANAITAACTANKNEGGTYNVGTGKGYTLNQLATIIENILSLKVSRCFTEKSMVDIPVNILNPSKFSAAFSWNAATEIEEGISLTIDHLRRIRR